jgi:DNA modification methylase
MTSQRAGRSNVAEQIQRGMSNGRFCPCGAWIGELGQEPTPDLYTEHLVDVFREVRRVLRLDGLLFLNIGDTYAAERGGTAMPAETLAGGVGGFGEGASRRGRGSDYQPHRKASAYGLKHKDLVGVPWRLAFALQADGWWLRNDIIWSTPNPMPESVRDRFTQSHEYVFMLAKDSRYFFDQDAVREPHQDISINRVRYGLNQTHPDGVGVAMPPMQTRKIEGDLKDGTARVTDSAMGERFANPAGRNRRDVWTISTVPYKGAHYAVFPPKLVEPMILAATSAKGVCAECGAPYVRQTEEIKQPRGDAFGTKVVGEYDHGQAGSPYVETIEVRTLGWEAQCGHDAGTVPATVLDPFGGSGTVGMVAQSHSRKSVLIDLNPEYLAQQLTRNAQTPLGFVSDAIPKAEKAPEPTPYKLPTPDAETVPMWEDELEDHHGHLAVHRGGGDAADTGSGDDR